MQQLILKPGFAKPLWSGHPFIFPKAIATNVAKLHPGQWVEILDHQQQSIGYGVFNPDSLYQIRLLAWSQDALPSATLDAAIRLRLQQALALRQTLSLPSAETNVYRLVNSEGDGLSGVTIDVFAQDMVVAVSARWAMLHQEKISSALKEIFPHHTQHWRPTRKPLAQDGWKEEESNSASTSMKVTVQELGLQYEVDLLQGQKTGFYCDQRDNRMIVRKLAANRRVLDLFCYSGGFSLNAARGGATSVKGVDSSVAAIALAQRNAELNKFSQVEFVAADAMAVLQETGVVDFIILDPPKLAPSAKHVRQAEQHYLALNRAALEKLERNGLLLTCSCSQAIDETALQRIVVQAALQARKKVQLLHVGRVGLDHPANPAFGHNDYLQALLLRVE